MLQLGRDADGRRAATHPSTGAVYPSNLIGAIAPGTGDPVNGMVVNATDSSYPRGLTESQGGILFGRLAQLARNQRALRRDLH